MVAAKSKEEEHLAGAGQRRGEGGTATGRDGAAQRPRSATRAGIVPDPARCPSGGERTKSESDARRERKREKKAAKPGAKRVLWTETRNLATNDVMRGSRIMEATARDAPVLKKLAGVKATGRKLKKPVVHYSLSWAKDERPERREMQAAVAGSLKTLGLQDRQALVVAHGDTAHPHVHVIVNRVNPETGKAANMGRDRIKLSKWAEGYERKQGRIRCPQRQANNYRRARGEWVRGKGKSQAQHHRGRVRMRRETKAADPDRISQVAWWRAEERTHWEKGLKEREQAVGELETRQRQDWREVYQYHQEQRDSQTKACRSVWGRLKTWSAEGRRLSEAGASIDRKDRRRGALEDGSGETPPDVAGQACQVPHAGAPGDRTEDRNDLPRFVAGSGRTGAMWRAGPTGGASAMAITHEVDSLRGREWVDREKIEQRRELYDGPTYEQVLKDRAERSARIEQSIRQEARERPREPERSRERDDGPEPVRETSPIAARRAGRSRDNGQTPYAPLTLAGILFQADIGRSDGGRFFADRTETPLRHRGGLIPAWIRWNTKGRDRERDGDGNYQGAGGRHVVV